MCPDRQILSLYIDGEIPSPWKEKAESHLASCAVCRSRLDEYRGLHAVIKEAAPQAGDDTVKEAQERVWARLTVSKPGFSLVETGKRSGWKRSISLPLPAAAAAAAIFAFAALLAVRGLMTPARTAPYEQVSGIGVDLQGIVSTTDMDGILQYLSSQDSGDYAIIQLPETRSFSSYGEPALVRAADYSGRMNRGRTTTP